MGKIHFCVENTMNMFYLLGNKREKTQRFVSIDFWMEMVREASHTLYANFRTKVASTHGNHNVYITEIATGKNIRILSGHPRTPWCIAFHPSCSQILASGCLGGQVRVWDLSVSSFIANKL